jgi:hypothetical protein
VTAVGTGPGSQGGPRNGSLDGPATAQMMTPLGSPPTSRHGRHPARSRYGRRRQAPLGISANSSSAPRPPQCITAGQTPFSPLSQTFPISHNLWHNLMHGKGLTRSTRPAAGAAGYPRGARGSSASSCPAGSRAGRPAPRSSFRCRQGPKGRAPGLRPRSSFSSRRPLLGPDRRRYRPEPGDPPPNLPGVSPPCLVSLVRSGPPGFLMDASAPNAGAAMRPDFCRLRASICAAPATLARSSAMPRSPQPRLPCARSPAGPLTAPSGVSKWKSPGIGIPGDFLCSATEQLDQVNALILEKRGPETPTSLNGHRLAPGCSESESGRASRLGVLACEGGPERREPADGSDAGQ